MKLAQRMRFPMSRLISPSPAMYAGTAYIITCIIPSPATASRSMALRRSRRRLSSSALMS